uniref:Reverse transcriptase domain-containing protein n=1 Tax=Fagus sylvatica TaxID=28930 RepID=A0A2N9H1D4_FAGSY
MVGFYGGFGSQWVGVGCGVFLGGFVGWLAVAHGGGATHGLPWVALKCLVCGCGSIFGGKEICESGGGNSKEESGSTGWSDQRETVDGELPLIFSDTVMVRKSQEDLEEAMMIAAFYFSLHAFRCKCNWGLEAIFAIIISLHSGSNYLIFLYIAKSPKINDFVMLRWEGTLTKDMQLSTPGLPLEMLKEKEWGGLVVVLSHSSQFSDDLLIFTAADPSSIQLVKNALLDFEKISGLAVNPSKSEIFCAATSEHLKNQILEIRILRKGSSHIFILPKKVVVTIEQCFNQFLWKGRGEGRGGVRVAWEKVCLPKNQGGLGLKRVKDWNRASIMKFIWNLFTQAGSLWAAWVQHYLLKGKFLWTIKIPQDCTWASQFEAKIATVLKDKQWVWKAVRSEQLVDIQSKLSPNQVEGFQQELVEWASNHLKGTNCRAVLYKLAWWAAVYHIWQQRNAIIHCRRIKTEEQIVRDIKRDVKGRVESTI